MSFFCSVGQGMKYPVQIEPLVGEMLKPVSMSEGDFITMQGTYPVDYGGDRE